MKKFLTAITLFALAGPALAQTVATAAATPAVRSVGDGLIAIGVGLAQASIGSAGAGTLAERPQAFGQILIYLVIPETLIIFGFVIAFFLNAQIG